ncbi:MarR family winged helix-turn-helix transcriptional regulator [Sphingomonas abietis]|uniref:MarR family transcriptional regulator n=1 Tax=Sphingomonas abietis TaxID=3012344 RepID=A0ABY7NQQ2_9SPHN|nr:MarR family transcriptional regulator [Sphingomonas abietis]WBO22882.1 MarR family transcriptional regulator [Sphingomonas abietis]
MSIKGTDNWALALTWMVLPAGRAWQQAAGVALSRLGLSLSAAAPLLVIARLGDGVRQRDVAEEAAIDPAAIARSVLQLENDGLLLRRADANDARAKTLHLTAAGHELAIKLERALDALRSELLKGISARDGQAAVRVLLALESASPRLIPT